MGEYYNVVKPCLASKLFQSLERDVTQAIAPLFYGYLKTVGMYSFGMEGQQLPDENTTVDHFRLYNAS